MKKTWYLEYIWWFAHKDNASVVGIKLKAENEDDARIEARKEWEERSKNMPHPDSLGYYYVKPCLVMKESLEKEVLEPTVTRHLN
jgi:hypothetical protein